MSTSLHRERGRIWSAIIDALQGPYTEFSDKIRDPKWRSFVDVRLHGIVWGTKEAAIRAFEKWRETTKPDDFALTLEAIKDKQFPREDAPEVLATKVGRCPMCLSWTINPVEPRCSGCEGRVAPLGPLEVFQVEDGVRVNVQGRLLDAQGRELHEHWVKNPEREDGPVAFVRRLLLAYDEGKHTEGTVGYEVFRYVIDPVFESAQSGQDMRWISSWCGPEPRPAERVTVSIERYAGNVTITPIVSPP